jgi:hypothetical protein
VSIPLHIAHRWEIGMAHVDASVKPVPVPTSRTRLGPTALRLTCQSGKVGRPQRVHPTVVASTRLPTRPEPEPEPERLEDKVPSRYEVGGMYRYGRTGLYWVRRRAARLFTRPMCMVRLYSVRDSDVTHAGHTSHVRDSFGSEGELDWTVIHVTLSVSPLTRHSTHHSHVSQVALCP